MTTTRQRKRGCGVAASKALMAGVVVLQLLLLHATLPARAGSDDDSDKEYDDVERSSNDTGIVKITTCPPGSGATTTAPHLFRDGVHDMRLIINASCKVLVPGKTAGNTLRVEIAPGAEVPILCFAGVLDVSEVFIDVKGQLGLLRLPDNTNTESLKFHISQRDKAQLNFGLFQHAGLQGLDSVSISVADKVVLHVEGQCTTLVTICLGYEGTQPKMGLHLNNIGGVDLLKARNAQENWLTLFWNGAHVSKLPQMDSACATSGSTPASHAQTITPTATTRDETPGAAMSTNMTTITGNVTTNVTTTSAPDTPPILSSTQVVAVVLGSGAFIAVLVVLVVLTLLSKRAKLDPDLVLRADLNPFHDDDDDDDDVVMQGLFRTCVRNPAFYDDDAEPPLHASQTEILHRAAILGDVEALDRFRETVVHQQLATPSESAASSSHQHQHHHDDELYQPHSIVAPGEVVATGATLPRSTAAATAFDQKMGSTIEGPTVSDFMMSMDESAPHSSRHPAPTPSPSSFSSAPPLDLGIINATDEGGNTALSWAVVSGQQRSVQWLLASGADCTRANHKGHTPLALACLHGTDIAVVWQLLAAGARPITADVEGSTPLHFAARQEDPAIADALISHGADVNVIDTEGLTPLMIACSLGRTETVKVLLQQKELLDVQRKDLRGNTALHWAARMNETDALRLLIDTEADISTVNAKQETPLHVAVAEDHQQAAQVLLAAAEAANQTTKLLAIRDTSDCTPEHRALTACAVSCIPLFNTKASATPSDSGMSGHSLLSSRGSSPTGTQSEKANGKATAENKRKWRRLYMRRYRAQARREDAKVQAHVEQVEADNMRLKAAVSTLQREAALLRSLLSVEEAPTMS